MTKRDGRDSAGPGQPTRRVVLGAALLVAGLSGATGMPLRAAIRAGPGRRVEAAPVVAFHADRLYLDHSGTAEPFRPPSGLRTLDGFDEETLARLAYSW
ncbi:MAG TPA: hypothetical protein VNZ43_01500 [Sphingomonadaceae bacterium]|nr:hypothetical protein [Sphingomonadaceae bacterium]